MKRIAAVLVLCCPLAVPVAFSQTTVTLSPTRDSSIFSEAETSAGADENLFIGQTAARQAGERRILLGFDDLSAIPFGATITAVELDLAVTRGVGPPIPVAAYALTTNWGEGASNPAGAGGMGTGPQPGDATWEVAMMPRSSNQLWQTPGGDFDDAAELSQTNIPVSGTITFPSTPELVAQVQAWADGSAENFGLILDALSSQDRSAKRLGARENGSANNRPALRVTFTEGTSGETALTVSGLWFDADLPGDGFNVIESPATTAKGALATSNNITIFYFGYDADGDRLWLVSETIPGPFIQNQPITFNMLQGGTSGNFQTPPPGTELAAWGTLVVTLADCVSGSFVLDGLDGSKTFAASQLTAVDGINCSAAR
ncbi:MAG: DNRLRE domain-containing protein [Pseudomonadota bacterium]